MRLSQTVNPTSLDLDMEKYSSYTDNGKDLMLYNASFLHNIVFTLHPGALVDPSVLHTSLQSHILKLKQRKVLKQKRHSSVFDGSSDFV